MLKKAMLCAATFLTSVTIWTISHAESVTATKEMLSRPCISCHGPGGYSAGPASPSIGGQTKNYLISIMLGYKHHDEPDEIDKLMESGMLRGISGNGDDDDDDDDDDNGDNGDNDDNDDDEDDFEIYPRYSTIMSRLMKGYTLKEIELIAEYFSSFQWKPAKQPADAGMANTGRKLHKKNCEKCHEDGGTSSEDDIGILAGQWMQYLDYTLEDYSKGRSKMPKKMRSKLKGLMKKHGKDGVHNLIHFYSNSKS